MSVPRDLAVVPRRLTAWLALVVLAVAIVAGGLLRAKPAAADGDPCPCGLLAGSAVPGTPNDPDPQAQQQGIELGLQFTSDVPGFVSAIRFYKGSGNVGFHAGDLWDANGKLVSLRQAQSFLGETASGWQTLAFPIPVPIAANTTYTAGYHSNYGSYSSDSDFFDQPVDAAPLHSVNGGGVYAYGGIQFPTSTFNNSNYWVDVVFDTHSAPAIAAAFPGPNRTGVSWQAPQLDSSGGLQVTFSEQVVPTSIHMELHGPDGSSVPGGVDYEQLMPGPSGVFKPSSALAPGTTYTLGVSGATDAAGFTMQPQTWSFTTTAALCEPCSIFPSSLAPAVPSSGDAEPVELGMTFDVGTPGSIAGIRFYKSSDNTGTHVGELWSSTGQLLASATFTNETPSGWQQVKFATPVSVNTTNFYVAAYHTDAGNYSETADGFQVHNADTTIPHLSGGLAGFSGSYAYGSAGSFPDQTFQASSYWVDILFFPPAPA
jgi:hypothetical protein